MTNICSPFIPLKRPIVENHWLVEEEFVHNS